MQGRDIFLGYQLYSVWGKNMLFFIKTNLNILWSRMEDCDFFFLKIKSETLKTFQG